jgi:hypothetical protein
MPDSCVGRRLLGRLATMTPRSHTVRAVLAALASVGLLAGSAPAHAAVPMSTSITDPAGDQAKGAVWQKYPKLRDSADLRRADFATSSGKLRLTWTFAASPGLARAYQAGGMSAQLKGATITFAAWRHGTQSYTSVSTGLGAETQIFCEGKGSVAVNPTKHALTMTVPVSCLPRGRVLASPYPTSYVTVLNKRGVVEGYVGSDSQAAAPDFAIRR